MSRSGRGSGRRRTADEIRCILDWQERSGLSLLAFARKHQLCYATLRRWRTTHQVLGPVPELPAALPDTPHHHDRPRPQFVPVELESAPRPGDFILECPSGCALRIPAGFDPDQLRRLLDVLGVRP